jgi:hypothetical protein
MRRTSPVALCAAAALVAAGCGGGGESDKQKIESTLRDYYTAFATGDTVGACADLTSAARDALAKAMRVKDCPAAIAKARERPDIKPYTARFRGARVVSVDVGGDIATATVSALGVTKPIPLRKEGGDWKIASDAGAAGD